MPNRKKNRMTNPTSADRTSLDNNGSAITDIDAVLNKESNGGESTTTNHHNGNSSSPSTYCGSDAVEVTRLIIQTLHELGYSKAAKELESESHCSTEAPQVNAFKKAILGGDWANAEAALESIELQAPDDLVNMLFDIRRQQYLELLEDGNVDEALDLLRNKLPLLAARAPDRHNLAQLLMCKPNELNELAQWTGKSGWSRYDLLQTLQERMSPSIMIPPHRLGTLLQQAKDWQIYNSNYWLKGETSFSLYRDLVDDRSKMPIATSHVLQEHTNEVWYVDWSPDGRYLGSSSLDRRIIIRDSTKNFKTVCVLKGHEAGIVQIAWSPNGSVLASASQDKTVKFWDMKDGGKLIMSLEAHKDFVLSCAWMPNGNEFLSASPDKNLILWNATTGQEIHRWTDHLVLHVAVTDDGQKIIFIDNSSNIHIYDAKTRESIHTIKPGRVLTSLTISRDSRYALVNSPQEEVLLFDLETYKLVRVYRGQLQNKFVIRSCFGGLDENFILSGSQDSRVYMWNRHTTDLIECLAGHEQTVNCVKWHPTNPAMFASASDDRSVRIWQSPSHCSGGINNN